MRWLILTAILSAWICSVHGGNTLKYASSCSVDLCTLKTGSNGGSGTCANPPPCYRFDTTLNTSICAPQVICSLFDACISGTRCLTSTSVCVINTCCAVPVCIPLALTGSCSMYSSNKTTAPPLPLASTICLNATWAANSTVVINNYVNNSYWLSLGDFIIDNYNNLYVIDSNSYRVLTFALNNTAVYNVAAVTNSTSTYQAQNLFVDSNGTIYTSESFFSVTTYYRVVQYSQNGVISGTTVYGPATCGTGASDMCGSGGLFVDPTGSIYYSDSSNHRVLKITPFASSANVIAGTSGISGSQLNQLNNPTGIYVDGNGALYVADQNNWRVMKFASGSLTGSVLFTLASYQSPTSLIVDNAGSVYAGTYNSVFRWIPGSNNTIQVISSMYTGGSRVRFDTYGNLYINGFMQNSILRYNITANVC